MNACATRKILYLTTLAALTALTACGGGGGGDGGGEQSPPPAPAPPAPAPAPSPVGSTDPKLAAGFWSGRVDPQTTASAVFLPDGQAWTVLQTTTSTAVGTGTVSSTLTTLARGTVTVAAPSVTVTGISYIFGSTFSTAPYRMTGTVVPKSTLTLPPVGATATSPGQPATSWSYNTAYEAAARPGDITGRWTASLASGSIRLTLDVSATGSLTGSSTTGCTYSGTVLPHPASIAVFNLALSETCPSSPSASSASTYVGIATLNESRTILSAGYTTPDGALAGLFSAGR